MTGWAQVKGGREITPSDKAALDVWYVRNASFKLDIEIMFATIPMVLAGERIDKSAINRAWLELVKDGICDSTNLPDEYAAVGSRQQPTGTHI